MPALGIDHTRVRIPAWGLSAILDPPNYGNAWHVPWRPPTTRDKIDLILDFFFQFYIQFEGNRAILRVALAWAGFFMSIGVESMPQYDLEVDFMTLGQSTTFVAYNSFF